MTESIRDRFMADHQRLEALLERVRAACAKNDGPEASRLWTELDVDLRTHLRAEEEHLICAQLAVQEREVRVVVEEHRHIRDRLAELGVGFDSRVVRPEAVRNFIDELRAHAKTEDRLLYAWADGHLEPDRNAAIDALTRRPTA
jgi:hypothetical protein